MEAGLPFVRKLSRYNVETEAAMQEEGDIINGDISIKSYPLPVNCLQNLTQKSMVKMLQLEIAGQFRKDYRRVK